MCLKGDSGKRESRVHGTGHFCRPTLGCLLFLYPPRDRINQAARIGMLRPTHHLFGSAAFDDLAEIENVEPVDYLPHDRKIMGDE